MLRFLKRQKPKDDDATNIGNVLVEMGLLTKTQLASIVVDFKAAKDELLGQFIVRKTALTEDQIELAVLKQKIMRGESGDKVIDRLMEISRRSGDKVNEGLDGLTALSPEAINS
jgi:hypothetical protein